jgi:hypothetical protein
VPLGLGAVVPDGDLSPVRVEVFQIINQRVGTNDPEIPLVSDKETRLRVYVHLANSTGPRQTTVRVEPLQGGIGTQPQAPCFLFFNEVQKTVQPSPLDPDDFIMDARDDLSKTFNFTIPKYCPVVNEGNVTFRVTVVGPECPQCGMNNVTHKSATFYPVRSIWIKPYVVTYDQPGSPHDGKAPAADIAANFSRLYEIYPISGLSIHPWGAWSTPPEIVLDWNTNTEEGAASFKENWAALHDYFIATYGIDDVDSNMAIVHSDIVSCRGRSIGLHSIQGGGCGTYSHELGHTIGLPHASDFHGECDGGSCAPDWPYPHGGLAGLGFDRDRPNQFIGPTGVVIDGNNISFWHSHDFMSYGDCEEYAPGYGSGTEPFCKGWISPLHYAWIAQRLACGEIARYPDADCLVTNEPWNTLYLNRSMAEWASTPIEDLRLLAQAGAAAPSDSAIVRAASLQSERPYLHLNARLWPDGTTDLRPLFVRTSEPAPARDRLGRGSHAIELLDANGTVLFSRGVDPLPIAPDHGDAASGWYLNEVLPWHPNTARVVIRTGNQVVAERAVAGSAPQVRLLTPNDGTTLTSARSLTVQWEGFDPDGDELAYWLDYSADGGRTWQALARNLRGSSYDVSLNELRGTPAGLIRVLSSDGINTTEDVSDQPFVVAAHAPAVEISLPTAGVTLRAGEPIELRGAAFDVEDGLLPDGALSWSSTLGGPLGTGDHLQGIRLSSGEHVITLAATDRDGQIGTVSISVLVVEPEPAAMKTRISTAAMPD